MLRYVRGNLLDSPAQTLVNTVNTVGVMGKGIALQFRERYPKMYERYRECCQAKALDIGKLQLYRTAEHWILNFPTKRHWRRPSKLEWIELGLQKFVATYADKGITSVAFPMLGCGNGDLDWADVKPLMERYLEPLPIPVFIYLRPRSEHFVPEHRDATEIDRLTRESAHVQASKDGFLRDVFAKAGVGWTCRPPQYEPDDEVVPSPLPLVRIPQIDRQVSGDDFASLWEMLWRRGALAVDDLPGDLAGRPEAVHFLTQLPYLLPLTFVSRDDERSERGGVQLASAVRWSGADAEVAEAQ